MIWIIRLKWVAIVAHRKMIDENGEKQETETMRPVLRFPKTGLGQQKTHPPKGVGFVYLFRTRLIND